MSVKFLKIENPRFANIDKSAIFVDAVLESMPDTPVIFVASIDDVEEHGRVLFNRIINQEFGPIGDYSEPELTEEQIRLEELEWIKSQEAQILKIIEDYNREQLLPIEFRREPGAFDAEATYLDACEKYAQLRDYKESGDLHQSNRPF